ncbi:hypothetical protein, partial [Streptococcus pneumoniae]|uniref:hypothetical protein n=1 Tax=Streptococcus pneumoniae TaxID=1313 RepID=UPI001D0C69EE
LNQSHTPKKYINDYPIISTATPNISTIRHNISTYRQISQKTAPKPPTNPTPAPTPLQKKKTPGPPSAFPPL